MIEMVGVIVNRAWLYSLTIIVGLWISATACGGVLPDNIAEWPVNIWCWMVFGYIYRSTDRKERIEMLTASHLLHQWNYFLVRFGRFMNIKGV